MRSKLTRVVMLLAATLLAACGGPAPVAPTQTAIVLVEGTSPLATTAPEPTAVAATTAASTSTLASTETAPATEVTATEAASATPSQVDALSGDPLLRTYRSLVAIQLNAALVAEAVAQVQAGRLDPEEMPVAALALGALTQGVDEAVPSTSPPPALAAQWDEALARHAEVKALGARWLIGQATVEEVAAALVPLRADLQRLLAEADGILAAEYNVSAAELTAHRERLVAAVGSVFE